MTTFGNMIRREAQDAALDGLHDVGGMVLEDAQRRVPVGDPRVDPDPSVSLRASGRIDQDGAGWVVSFNTPYAAKVHERQQLQHPRGGEAKYLENAVTDIVPVANDVVSSKVQARLASGVLSSDPKRRHRSTDPRRLDNRKPAA